MLFLIIFLAIFGITFKVLALETTWPPSPFGTNLTDESTLTDLVKYIYEWGIFIGGIAVFISLLIGGFLYLTSAGNPGRMTEARDRIFSALIGLVLLFSIYLILNTINPELTIPTMPEFGITGEMLFKCDCAEGVNCPDCETNYKCKDDSNPGDGNKQGTCVFKGLETEPCSQVIFYNGVDCGGTADAPRGTVDCEDFGDYKTIASIKVTGGCSIFLYDAAGCGTPTVTKGGDVFSDPDKCDFPDIGAQGSGTSFQSVKIQNISF